MGTYNLNLFRTKQSLKNYLLLLFALLFCAKFELELISFLFALVENNQFEFELISFLFALVENNQWCQFWCFCIRSDNFDLQSNVWCFWLVSYVNCANISNLIWKWDDLQKNGLQPDFTFVHGYFCWKFAEKVRICDQMFFSLKI